MKNFDISNLKLFDVTEFLLRFGDPFDHLRDLFGDGFGKFRTGREQNIFHKQVNLKDCELTSVSPTYSTDEDIIEVSKYIYWKSGLHRLFLIWFGSTFQLYER